MPIESTERVDRGHIASPSPEREPLRDVCPGCADLAIRVERLERQLAARTEDVAGSPLGATGCYWICIGVHAFVTFGLFSNEIGLQFGMLAMAGAVGTLAVCHVLSTRPMHTKLLRSLLSITIVGTSAIIAMALADMGDAGDLLRAICVYVPFFVGSAWFVAKIAVWTRGWRVVPPGGASEFPKLRIWHLLLCTFVVAVYLALVRLLVTDTEELLSAEMVGVVLYVTLPAAVCTVFACALAKVILLQNNPRVFLKATGLVLIALMVTVGGWILVFVLSGEVDNILEVSLALALYAPLTVIGVFASPCFTFLMLWIANYRFIVPSRPIE
jgi:hypothetical protein